MISIIERVRSDLLPTVKPVGLQVLRYHGGGEAEVVDLVFRDGRINLYREKGYYEVSFGPSSNAAWFPARVVTAYLHYGVKDFSSMSIDETIAGLKAFLESRGEQLLRLLSSDGFAQAKGRLGGGLSCGVCQLRCSFL
jgi:hypothetical protein